MKTKESCFVQTEDDFLPSFKRDGKMFVEVLFSPLIDNTYRVGVWGNDDFGMIRDYTNSADATTMYRKIKILPSISIPWLKENGFSVF